MYQARKERKHSNVLRFASGLAVDLQDNSDARKTVLISDKLWRLQVDIVALQETHLARSGTPKEKDYTFYWQGGSDDEHREHGVGFAIRELIVQN